MRFLKFLFAMLFSVSIYPIDDHPIEFNLSKVKGNEYKLNISVPIGFGIQKEAPNKLLLGATDSLKITKADVQFKGNSKKDKPDYFEKVEDMSLNLTGKGNLILNGKIYYCDYNKNICIQGKIYKELKVE